MRDPLPETKARLLDAALRSGNRSISGPPPAQRRSRKTPLSFHQEDIWHYEADVARLHGRLPLRNQWFVVRLDGPLDEARLRSAILEIERRHENLRATFPQVGGAPVVRIAPPPFNDLLTVDLDGLAGEAGVDEALRLSKLDAATPFDLGTGPLVRLKLFRIAPRLHVLLLLIDHILFDGWSFSIFAAELSALYDAFCDGRASPLPELPLQYGDFADWERRHFAGPALERPLRYWTERLREPPPFVALPADHPRGTPQSLRAEHAYWAFSPEFLGELPGFARAQRASVFTVLYAAWVATLHRYTGETDISVGSSVANRGLPGTQALIGGFANTVLLRSRIPQGGSFLDVLAAVRGTVLGGIAHQELPLYLLERELPRVSFNVSTVFGLQNYPASNFALRDVAAKTLGLSFGTSTFDLVLLLIQGANGFQATVDYNADLFNWATIVEILDNFERTLLAGIREPLARLERLPARAGD